MNNYTVKYTIMRLFSNGCSFLTERPKNGVHTFVSKILSEKYDLPLSNIAMGGRGNDRINFSTKLWIEKNRHTKYFAVIGWSSSLRNDYISNDAHKIDYKDNFFSWRSYDLTKLPVKFLRKIKNIDIEKTSAIRWLTHVLDLQCFFKYKNIPYVMYNALPPFNNFNNDEYNLLFNKIDRTRFFKIETSQLEYIIKNNYIVSADDPHPSTEGHILWTEQLKDFIDANDLCTIR